MNVRSVKTDSSSRDRNPVSWMKYVAIGVLVFGTLFVGKEYLHASLGRKLSDVQAYRDHLNNEAVRLTLQVSQVDGVNTITSRAQSDLKMVFRNSKSDTVWIEGIDCPEPVVYHAGFLNVCKSH